MPSKIIPPNKYELQCLVIRTINKNGRDCDLNFIDVSNVTDMSYLFMNIPFEGDISQWNVSKVTNMRGMFWQSDFNADISNWQNRMRLLISSKSQDASNCLGIPYLLATARGRHGRLTSGGLSRNHCQD